MVELGWFGLSLITLILWGVWGLFGKLALNNLDWRTVYLVAGIGAIFVYLIFYAAVKPSLSFNTSSYYALVAGALGVGGTLTYYLALNQGKVSVVVPLTALYPVITVILATTVLNEKLTFYQGFGVLLAIMAIILISMGR